VRRLVAAAVSIVGLVAGVPVATAESARYPDLEFRVGDDPAWARDEGSAGWTRSSPYRIDPQGRILWIRSRVAVEPDPTSPLGVRVMAMASCEVHWNGALLGRNGRPGASAEEEVPGAMHAVFFVPPDRIRSGDNLLAIRMSSHHLPFRVGTPIHGVVVGPYADPLAPLLKNYLPALVVSGVVAMGALYFGLLFLADRRDRSSLALSLLSIAVIAQGAAETLRAFVNYAYPWHPVRLVAVIACACGFGLALIAFVSGRFAGRPGRYLIAFAVALPAVLVLAPGLDGRAMLALLVATLISLAAAFGGARAGKPGARPAVAALLFFILLLVVDPFHFLDRTFYLAVAALLAVLFPLQIVALRRERIAREQAQFRSTRLELDLLKRQIQPHFLMNTLTALSEWIESDPATGVRMIDALAQELRLLSHMAGQTLVAMGEELELCRHQLTVLSLRADRLFTLKVEGVDLQRRIPPAVFHTLIENAFTHDRFADRAEFLLEESREPGRIRYRLTCPPPIGTRSTSDKSAGTGLAYVKARLTEAFGEAWTLRSAPSPGGGWKTDIELPA
jgi:Histidine kinase